MTEKNSGLSVVINDNGHIAFNADMNFAVEEKEDVSSVHLADVVYSVVLDALKKQVGNARLAPGDFRLVLTGCVSDVSNTKEKTDDTTDAEQVLEAGDTGTESEEEAGAEEEATEETEPVAEEPEAE
jgi:hypothetical protein